MKISLDYVSYMFGFLMKIDISDNEFKCLSLAKLTRDELSECLSKYCSLEKLSEMTEWKIDGK